MSHNESDKVTCQKDMLYGWCQFASIEQSECQIRTDPFISPDSLARTLFRKVFLLRWRLNLPRGGVRGESEQK